MSRESIVFFLGIIIFILPHIGVPESWKVYGYAISGMVLMIVGYSLRQRAFIRSIETQTAGERDSDSFTEQVAPYNADQQKLNI